MLKNLWLKHSRAITIVLLSVLLFVLFPQLPLAWIGVLAVVTVFFWLLYAIWDVPAVQGFILPKMVELKLIKNGGTDVDEGSEGQLPASDEPESRPDSG